MNGTFLDGVRGWLGSARGLLGALLCGLLLAGALGGCGGGGSAEGSGVGGGVGSGGTGTFAVGPISGYGSILVNGVRYELGSLSSLPEDEDGNSRDVTTLQLGTMVRVEAGPIDASVTPPRAVATAIVVSSEVVGPVEALSSDASGVTLQVAGQSVRIVTGVTVLDERLAGAGPALGDWIEVYGVADAATSPPRIVATRIEPHAQSGAHLRGTVSDITAAGVQIGGAVYGLGGAAPPAGFSVGATVRLHLEGAPGAWQVAGLAPLAMAPTQVSDAEVEGRVTVLDSATSFVVNGIRVDASGVATTGLAVGVRIEVAGSIQGGVLVAGKLEIETEGTSSEQVKEFEVHGHVATVDAAKGSFTVSGRSELFRLTPTTRYEEGNASSVVPGVRFELRGTLNSDGRSIDVTRLHFED